MGKVKIIAKGGFPVGKLERHYQLTTKDVNELFEGKEVFFYQGKEIDIHFKLPPNILKNYKLVKNNVITGGE